MYVLWRAVKRNQTLFIIVIGFCLFASLLAIVWQPLGAVRTEVFTTMAADNQGQEGDASDAATYFAETVQGWLTNPALVTELAKKSGIDNFALSSHPQQRQNMIIDVTAAAADKSEELARILLEVLNKKITTYNIETDSSFSLIPQGMNTFQLASRSMMIYVLGGLIAGIFVGLFLIFSLESLRKRVSFAGQVRDTMQLEPLMCLESNSQAGLDTLNKITQYWSQSLLIAPVSHDAHDFMLYFINSLQNSGTPATIIDVSTEQTLISFMKEHVDVKYDLPLQHAEKKQIHEKGIHLQWFDTTKLSMKDFPSTDSNGEFVCIYATQPNSLKFLMNNRIGKKMIVATLGKTLIDDLLLIKQLRVQNSQLIILQ